VPQGRFMNAIKKTGLLKLMAVGLLTSALILPQVAFAAPEIKTSGGGKNWTFSAGVTAIRDDNLLGAPERGPIPLSLQGKNFDDVGVRWNSNLGYKYKQSSKLSFKFDYDVNQTIYEENSSRDITTQMFGINSEYKISPLVNIQMMYKYIYNIVNGDDFSGINYFRPSFNYMHRKYGMTAIHFLYSDTNNWITNLRNTETTGAGVAQYIFFSNYTRRLTIGYQYRKDDAKGKNFDLSSHAVNVGLKTPLFYGINLTTDAKYTQKDYKSRLAIDTRLREDNQQRYSLALDKMLISKMGYLQNLVLRGLYTHTYNRSTEDAVFSVNNHWELGLSAAF